MAANASRILRAAKFAKSLKFSSTREFSFLSSAYTKTTQSKYLGLYRSLSSQSEPKADATSDSRHTIITDKEKAKGERTRHEFQAETRMLLDIVARSLYSDKEVFVRELISNASDALEKLRYQRMTEPSTATGDRPLEIHLQTNKQTRTLTIQDTGIGMTREELVSNLGTIARSGSKAFLEQIKNQPQSSEASNIIGQFGVGFYSAFMVANKLEVYTRSIQPGSPGLLWTSDGSGAYEISEADDVQTGTKIVIHLKTECREYSDDETISKIIKKYSNFVGSPILLNSNQVNTIQPLWLLDSKEVTSQQHTEFYRFIGGAYDQPRFTLHYKTDAPLSIRALLYIPEGKPGLFEMSREVGAGVALYSRKVLIKSHDDNILPKWLRYVKGVVDSEDIPLNLSRELLQNSALISKLRKVLTNRILRFLHDKMTKNTEEYDKFYLDYGLFLKEGIITNSDQLEKEEISKLLRFESSHTKPGERINIPEYINRFKTRSDGQKEIYYIAAPSRELAESSPYYESLKAKKTEVLFCYEPYDELVFMQLRTFDKIPLTSVEKEMRQDTKASNLDQLGTDSLGRLEVENLLPWVQKILSGKVQSVTATRRLDTHPCVVSVEEMAAARHFVRTQSHLMSEEARYSLLNPRFELNPKHPIIKKLSQLTKTNPQLAELVSKQLFANAMVSSGLVEDPRSLLTSMNDLLELALEKH